MTVSYEQARAWAEDRLSFWEEWASGHEDGDDCPQGHSVIWQERATRTRADIAALRALIAAPPEPSEEEVAGAIEDEDAVAFTDRSYEAAKRVLALFRSRIKMSDWLPIESAPRGMPSDNVGCRDASEWFLASRPQRKTWLVRRRAWPQDDGWEDQLRSHYAPGAFTHWMPLPAPPTKGGE